MPNILYEMRSLVDHYARLEENGQAGSLTYAVRYAVPIVICSYIEAKAHEAFDRRGKRNGMTSRKHPFLMPDPDKIEQALNLSLTETEKTQLSAIIRTRSECAHGKLPGKKITVEMMREWAEFAETIVERFKDVK
jgi:hypothetical protein